MKKARIISSWDDYCSDNMRLADLLLRYKIPAVFFIECDNAEKVNQTKELAKMGFEIGSHTFSHPEDLKRLREIDLYYEIEESRKFLIAMTGQSIDWFCYPGGKYNDRVKEIVKEAGYRYARTTNLGIPFDSDPYAIYTLFHCYPHRKEYGGQDWLEYAKESMTNVVMALKGEPEIHFWGHGWEITKFDNWEKLEELFKWIKEYIL